MQSDKILYFTDKLGVSSGYQAQFQKILLSKNVQIHPAKVIHTSVYSEVPKCVGRKGNAKAPIGFVEFYSEVLKVFEKKVSIINPKVIVTSCPAILMILTERDPNANTIEKTRGGVYYYKGIPVIVSYPISVINRLQEKNQSTLDPAIGDYSVKLGGWVLSNDWQKIARFYHDTVREVPAFNYSVVRTVEDIKYAESFLLNCVAISDDIETVGGNRTVPSCYGFGGIDSKGRVKCFVFPLFDKFKADGCYWESKAELALCLESVRKIRNCKALKIFQNGAYDNSYGVRDRVPARNYLADTIHMWHCIFPELIKRLDFISSILLDQYQYWKMDIKGLDDKDETAKAESMEKYWRYNALDCYYTLFNCCYLSDIIFGPNRNQFTDNYCHEFMANLSGLKMSLRGINKDTDKLKEHLFDLELERSTALARLRKITNDNEFNPESPAQVKWLLYGMLGAQPRDDKGKRKTPRSKKFSPSSGERAFKLIKTEHPMYAVYIDAITDAKQPKKQISNVIQMGLRLITKQFRYALNAAGTETWRYSGKSSHFWEGTNPQNLKKKYRDWLVAGENELLFDVDYSQSDDYFVAFESQDEHKISVVLDPRDTHAVHTAFFFPEIDYAGVIRGKKAGDDYIVHPTKGLRNLTKRIAHGANFQMAAGTLYVTMGKEAVISAAVANGHKLAHTWTESELITFIGGFLRRYHEMYPGLRIWYKDIEDLLIADRQITSAYGYTRKFMGNPTDPATQREATAFYGQNGTAGNMNRVYEEINFGLIPERFRDGLNPHRNEKPLRIDGAHTGLLTRLQVHDSIIGSINYTKSGWKENLNNLLTVMERPVIIHGREFFVPANLELGKRWGKGMSEISRSDIMSLDSVKLLTATN